tara:strand:- start:58 stop:399 length:342 start_codon:yes stop_codon:yes gene_type:complete
MVKTKNLSNKRCLNKKKSNKTRLNKRRSNKTRLNKTRSNKRNVKTRNLKKRRSSKKLKGGFFRGTILPQDIVNIGRGVSHGSETLLNNLQGNITNPSPYPTLDQPIDNSPILA